MTQEQRQILDEMTYALEFTRAYQSETDKALREVRCFQVQVPHIRVPIAADDLIAGRMQHGFLGFSPQYGGRLSYFFHAEWAWRDYAAVKDCLDAAERTEIESMLTFWEKENTEERLGQRFEDQFGFRYPLYFTAPGAANCDGRLAGMHVDLDKLIRLGIPGLREEAEAYAAAAPENTFYQGLLAMIDLLADTAAHYAEEARANMRNADDKRQKELARMAAALERIQLQPPQTFFEGLQLLWIYVVNSDLMNYGRMDVYLGDLYAADLDSGRMSEEEAVAYLLSIYRHILRINDIYDARIVIGGRGRRNEENADRLAMALMEASARFQEVIPQLTLRYYHGMNDAVYQKALEVNAMGTTYPILYSDDTNIPAVQKVYGVSEAEAERYLPFGCGEYVLEGLSIGTPNTAFNVLKNLELTLFNGYDLIFETQAGEKTGEMETVCSFEDLFSRYEAQMAPHIKRLAWFMKANYTVANEQASFLYYSLLMDDCLARGKALLDGGVRYENAASEIFGIMSTADCLTAIKKVVFEDRAFTLPALREMLRVDFEGFEKERRLLQAAPKYGNDNAEADAMAQRVFDHVASLTRAAGDEVGLNRYNIVSVNNSMSAEWGAVCAASADGRHARQAMSNGNGPSIGADKKGVTALFNSMSKISPDNHVGVINNIRFTKEMFRDSFTKVKLLVSAFLENNGVQLNISAVGREDLEQAMQHPENYQNLLVRIGGFSARFVTLDKVIQKEILARTTYEG